jgi:hypothetical protein
MPVRGKRVSADDQEPDVMRDAGCDELAEVAV